MNKSSGVKPPNYTQIPNEFLDKLMRDLSGSQWKVLCVLCRHTFGDHRYEKTIPIKQISAQSGLSESSCKSSIHELADLGLLIILKNLADDAISCAPNTYVMNVSEDPENDTDEDPLGSLVGQNLAESVYA